MSFAIAGIIIAGATLGYTVYNNEESKKKIRSQEDDARRESSRLQTEADNEEAVSNETELQQKARARQKALAGSGVTPPGSLLGAGLASNTNIGSASGKTLLGS